MLRERSYIQEVEHLKLEVERKFGRRILISSDCTTLANEIYRKTNNQLSFNTVRRCFNIMKSDYQPSLHTLDSLAIYCGFTSFGSYVSVNKHPKTKRSEIQPDHLVKFIILLFKEIEFQAPSDITYLEFVKLTIGYLEADKKLITELQKHLSKTYNGQVLYYEYFINIDKLNSFYGDGLKLYLSEKKAVDGQVFGLSLLCFRSWLNNDQKELEEFYFKIVAISLNKSADAIIWARYFTALLFYYEKNGYSKDQIIEQSRKYFINSNIQNLPIGFQTSFEIILAEALLLTGEVDEALYYINIAQQKQIVDVPDYINLHITEVIKLFSAWCMMEKDMYYKAREILKTISTENFFLFSKQYFNILFLQVKYTCYKKTKDTKELISLIEETGFIKLVDMKLKFGLINKLVNSSGNNGQ